MTAKQRNSESTARQQVARISLRHPEIDLIQTLEDIPVAVIRKATATNPILIYFIDADHLNTPRVIVNQSNTRVCRWDNIHAFGASLND